MEVGDKLEWKGLCRTYSGMIAKSEDGELIVKMDDGKFFQLKDVIKSPSLKVTMV